MGSFPGAAGGQPRPAIVATRSWLETCERGSAAVDEAKCYPTGSRCAEAAPEVVMKAAARLALSLIAVMGLGSVAGADPATREQTQQRALTIFAVLPAVAESKDNPVTPAKVELGRRLFYEQRFSISQKLSCNSCHGLSSYGVDNEATSIGHAGQRGTRNSPTVYNAAFQFAQFWDGRAANVEEQAKGPILNPVEMGMPSAEVVVKTLREVPGYAPLFAKAFPGEADPISYDNMGNAIGAFERRLSTPSPFDAFLGGKLDALSDAQLAGLQKFLDTGCTACHNGAPVGGLLFQKLGLVNPYPTEDLGRYEVTKKDADKYFFKVPSLRNIHKTAPYFHDGSIKTLDEAIRLMAWHQLGKQLTPAEIQSISAFLGSLTGEIDQRYIAPLEPLAAERRTGT
jgi:cytochrome c peroxidase